MNLALSPDLGSSELLSVLDSGIAVDLLSLWCEPLVLGHLLSSFLKKSSNLIKSKDELKRADV